MNNEIFKKFIEPYFALAVSKLTPVFSGTDPLDHLTLIVGFICGSALTVASEEVIYADWRDGGPRQQSLGVFTHEEVRRIFDYARLRLETGSATS